MAVGVNSQIKCALGKLNDRNEHFAGSLMQTATSQTNAACKSFWCFYP
jgi:hypothetical protein